MPSEIIYPALYRQGDNVCTGGSAQELGYKLKTLAPVIGTFDRTRSGVLFDAGGRRFVVGCWRDVPAASIFEKIWRVTQFAPAREPVVDGSIQLSLDDFKREVESAISAFAKASQDPDLAIDLRVPLARASTYAETLAAVPGPV